MSETSSARIGIASRWVGPSQPCYGTEAGSNHNSNLGQALAPIATTSSRRWKCSSSGCRRWRTTAAPAEWISPALRSPRRGSYDRLARELGLVRRTVAAGGDALGVLAKALALVFRSA
jgi:hypothetical protein